MNTEAYNGLGFQHLPQDLANVNVWTTMFDPYIERQKSPFGITKMADCRLVN